ncbi:MAG: alpha/beta hydrolase domain-containing protein [Clostridia bacterium]|nr:alpha/beta hydrolase domain-containing protein [Clostridia bacterium]
MIEKLWQVPCTEVSHPYLQAGFRCEFAKNGYVEDEYFFSGTANVYAEEPEGTAKIIYERAPYCTRFLLRRPEDTRQFSGNVVLEVLNATANMDIDRIWVNSWKYFTRNGDIYVGITSKSSVLGTLMAADAGRYAPLCWDNPLPQREKPKQMNMFGFDERYEWGLFWDMLTDLASALRSSDGILQPYGTSRVYLTGWSQSAGYLSRMVHTFPDKAYALFDGFMAAGGGGWMQPLNAYEPMNTPKMFAGGKAPTVSMHAAKPYIALNTQSEMNWVNFAGDSHCPGALFRVYEIAGGSHDTKYSLIDYYQEDIDTIRIGRMPKFEGTDGEPSDYPYEPLFNAAWRNLFVWVRDDVPAPCAPRLERDADAKPVNDLLGHAMGGLRTAALRYPTVRYFTYSTLPNGVKNPLWGHIEPIAPSTLEELYGTLDQYRQLVAADCARRVASGFMLTEDVDDLVNRLVSLADKRGLHP